MSKASPSTAIRCVELSPELWPALETLFGKNGACGGCWCMWWRVERGGKLWDEMKGANARRTFEELVTTGQARGILAFAGDAPVGWCAFGPRSEFPRVERSRAYRLPAAHDVAASAEASAEIWSINCFFVARPYRGQGVARALLDAAVKACRGHGARVVEGYPVTATRDGKKLAAAFAWTGPVEMFTDAGFDIVQADPPTRPLVRRSLRPGRKRA